MRRRCKKNAFRRGVTFNLSVSFFFLKEFLDPLILNYLNRTEFPVKMIRLNRKMEK